jgi:hypothetical protein
MDDKDRGEAADRGYSCGTPASISAALFDAMTQAAGTLRRHPRNHGGGHPAMSLYGVKLS